jgi:murein DD-endopeptidase MepM/ murein hydrolase activator NlpD
MNRLSVLLRAVRTVSALVGVTTAVTSFGCLQDDSEGEPVAEVDQALGKTPPAAGAEAKPSGFPIVPPWKAGKAHNINRGYGQGAHKNTNSTGSSNDHHALDFDLVAGEAVYPIAGGQVLFAGEATGGFACYGNFIVVQHSVGGQPYQSLYAHLDSIDVANNAIVTTGTVIGKAGNSGSGKKLSNGETCVFNPHLHLALYHGAQVQTSGSIGPKGGHAVVPEKLGGCTKASPAGEPCKGLVVGNRLIKSGAPPTGGSCPCPPGDNFCNHPPSTPNCPMTYPGGYCDPNGNGTYDDGNWLQGYNEYQSLCT